MIIIPQSSAKKPSTICWAF